MTLGIEQADCLLQIDSRTVPCDEEFPSARSFEQLPAEAAEWVPQAEFGWFPTPQRRFGLLLRRGLLPGGARVNPADGSIVTYRPERSDTIDLEWTERLGQLEAKVNLFANRWSDRQVRIALAGRESYLIRNVGEARARGGELLLRWHADPAWLAWAGLGYLDTRFRRFTLPRPGGESELAGNRFAGAPPWTATLGMLHRRGRWEVAASVWGTAPAFSDATNSALGERPGHVIADLKLSRALGANGTLWFAVDNLTDAESLDDVRVAGLTPTVREYVPGTPRQWRLGVRWHW